jgi:pimeloyl-ACP methyl ester carboxylesterase
VLKKILPGLILIIVVIGAFRFFLDVNDTPDLSQLEATYVTPADRFVEIDGVRVRVREEGPIDAPVLLLMHGFIYSLETWNDWADHFSATYRVIRFDLPGHGLTGPDPKMRYSPDERAAFVGQVMDALGVEHAIIGGNSLGGLAAWKFAVLSPERVDALVLVSAGAYPVNGVGDTPIEAPAAMKLFLRTAPETGIDATLKRVFSDAEKATPARAKLLRDMMRREGNGEAYIQSIAKFSLPDPTDELSRINAPTLILWGDDDVVIPVDHAHQIADAIPNARLIIYEGVGHVPQEEAADRSANDVEDFLIAIGPLAK